MTKYTITNSTSGTVEARGLTAIQAMDHIMTHDGHAYEIRKADPKWRVAGETAWELWHSDGSANSPRGARHMVRTVIRVYAQSLAEAEEKIADAVIAAAWPRLPEAQTDEAYDAILAEIAEDEAE